MNNIVQFPSYIEYPDFDNALLLNSARDAGTASNEVRRLFVQTNYLTSLHDRIVGMDEAVRNSAFKLKEVAQTTNIVLLQHTKTLKNYQAELIGSDDSDREEIQEDICKQAGKIITAVNKGHTTLQKLSASLGQPLDRFSTDQFLVQLATEQERLPKEIEGFNERMGKLEAQRQTLTEAMALIESKSFAQVGKDTMLSAQEIAKLGMAGPEVAVIEKAIELAQQLMEKLETLVNYFGLMDARNAVRKQMDDLVAQTEQKARELSISVMKSNLITECHNFDDHRTLYAAEFEKVIIANQSFLNVHRAADWESESSVSELVADTLALASYLKVAG